MSVVVVGASSAGLLAAERLARAGEDVQVFEQAERLAPAPRTLSVTGELTRALGFTPAPAILNRVQRFELRSNGTLARLELAQPDLVIERAELLRLLAARAERAGARVRLGYRFARFERDGARTLAVLRQRGSDREERVAARAVIGADGAPSAIAAALGQPPRPSTSVIQARVALPPDLDPALCRVWFAPRETRYFYWLIPEGGGTAAVGLVDDDARAARPKLDRFLARQGLAPLEYQAARAPLYAPRAATQGQVGRVRVYLVGDAAAQIKVTTVGGTVSGLLGAAAAARAVLRDGGYHRELRPLTRELTLHWLIRALWNRFGEEDYSTLLSTLNRRVAAVLQACPRDRWTAALWPLLAARPQIVALAARAARG